MPTYCYQKPDGSIIEKIMTIAEMEVFDENPVEDGLTLKRRLDVEMGGFVANGDTWATGLVSEAAACHPDDVPSYKKHAAKHGVPTEYNKAGCPIFTSRNHRAKYLKTFGLHDRNGGYSDG